MGTKVIVNDRSAPILVTAPSQTKAVVVVGGVGPVGPAGADGNAGADKNHEHVQGVASSVWAINHGLNKRPAVTVLTSAGDEVEGDVVHVDANNLHITFTAAFAGRAICN